MATLSSEERDKLPSSQFALPNKRMFPMPNEEHTQLALDMLNNADISDSERAEAKTRILARMKELGMHHDGVFKQYFDIAKLDKVQKIVYGKALVPNTWDSQQDTMTKEDIETTAHNFLIDLQKAYVELLNGHQVTDASQIGLMHTVFKGVGGFGYVVESYIDLDGSWVLATKINDDSVWDKIINGEITGYSVGGKGQRIPV